jgi:hypothetical protein
LRTSLGISIKEAMDGEAMEPEIFFGDATLTVKKED